MQLELQKLSWRIQAKLGGLEIFSEEGQKGTAPARPPPRVGQKV